MKKKVKEEERIFLLRSCRTLATLRGLPVEQDFALYLLENLNPEIDPPDFLLAAFNNGKDILTTGYASAYVSIDDLKTLHKNLTDFLKKKGVM